MHSIKGFQNSRTIPIMNLLWFMIICDSIKLLYYNNWHLLFHSTINNYFLLFYSGDSLQKAIPIERVINAHTIFYTQWMHEYKIYMNNLIKQKNKKTKKPKNKKTKKTKKQKNQKNKKRKI